ncbi:MAG: RNA polymerase sigma factor [Nitrospirota bacterium]
MSRPTADIPDERLVEAAISGDDDAFADIVSRYKRKVIRTASRFARDSGELDDLSQDVFIRVYKGLKNFRGAAPFEHWLMRIAVRTCYDFLNERRRRKDSLPLEDFHDIAVEDGLKDFDAFQAKEILNKALSRLKPKERLVITLMELEERTVKEVSALTGWSEANVKVRAFRARLALKKKLGVEDE